MSIKKGQKFLCIKDFIMSGVILFVKGNTYVSPANNSLTDSLGEKRMGWNRTVLEDHFYLVPVKPIKIWFYILAMITIVIFLLLAISCTAVKSEAPNACGYITNTGQKVYEQHCDPSNIRNVGEPVCIEGNIIVDCTPSDKQFIIKEVLR